MITHILVHRAVSQFLEARGYHIHSWLLESPLTAKHPELGEIEVYFYGENYTFDEKTMPFGRLKWTRSETIQIWKTEKTMLDEESAHVCIAKAVLLMLHKLATRKTNRRIGLALPDVHNFMTHLQPLVHPLTTAGIEFFFVCSDLSIAPIGKSWEMLPAGNSTNPHQIESQQLLSQKK